MPKKKRTSEKRVRLSRYAEASQGAAMVKCSEKVEGDDVTELKSEYACVVSLSSSRPKLDDVKFDHSGNGEWAKE